MKTIHFELSAFHAQITMLSNLLDEIRILEDSFQISWRCVIEIGQSGADINLNALTGFP